MTDSASPTRTGKIAKADAAWRALLRARECSRARPHDTERVKASRLHGEIERSMLACRCCGEPLLAVDVKFDYAAGWASFDTPAAAAAVSEPEDRNPLMRRTEVRCARCPIDLGRVLPSGPSATMGLRSAASGVPLQFKPGGT